MSNTMIEAPKPAPVDVAEKPRQYTDVMIDFETLGQTGNSVVLSGAYLLFDLEETENFDVLHARVQEFQFDIAEQMAADRRVDPATLKFWFEQAAKGVPVPGEWLGRRDWETQGIAELCRALEKSCVGSERLWWRGINLDGDILRSFPYAQALIDRMFDFRRLRDARTYVDEISAQMRGYSADMFNEMRSAPRPVEQVHNAGWDCVYQVRDCQWCNSFLKAAAHALDREEMS